MSKQNKFSPDNIPHDEETTLHKFTKSISHLGKQAEVPSSEFTPHTIHEHLDTDPAATENFTPHNIPEDEPFSTPDKLILSATGIISAINIFFLITPFYYQPLDVYSIFNFSSIAAGASVILYALTTYSITNTIISSAKYKYYVAASLFNALNILIFTFINLQFIFILLATLSITAISSLTIISHRNATNSPS